MPVHDLQRARVASHAPATQGSAIVHEIREQTYVLGELPDLQTWAARRAASCLHEPRVGDRVWFVAEAGPPGQQRSYVTAVLERAAGEVPARLSVEGAGEVHVEAEVLRLRAEAKLEIQTDEVRVQGRAAGLDAGFVGGLDGAKQGDLAVVVEIYANAKVDLGATGIGIEGFIQAEDRVTRGHRYGAEQGHGGFLSA